MNRFFLAAVFIGSASLVVQPAQAVLIGTSVELDVTITGNYVFDNTTAPFPHITTVVTPAAEFSFQIDDSSGGAGNPAIGFTVNVNVEASSIDLEMSGSTLSDGPGAFAMDLLFDPSILITGATLSSSDPLPDGATVTLTHSGPNSLSIEVTTAIEFDDFFAGNGGFYTVNLEFGSLAVIPEPATAGLALFGLAGLGMRRRRAA